MQLGENHKIGLKTASYIKENRAVFIIINSADNPETGERDILDVFIYNRKYELLDWIYGLADPDDNEVGISMYNYEWIMTFINKYFSKYTVFVISEDKKEDFIKGKYINLNDVLNLSYDNRLLFNASNESEERKIFDISLLKIQQFLNFMDTDSIPLYFKNIAVIENELGNHKKALFYIKSALKKNRSQEILDELLVVLVKLKKFKLIKRLTNRKQDSKNEKQFRAYALKMTGEYRESLKLYKKLYKEHKEAWIKDDIRWLEDELD
ncbi:MAG: hypothetical protein C0601_12305 [Candidatus Muiribacterium halophilum]|uniref:Tetratricopeptide repeat protein n=1 Tax=Muiribacterium halophilum TaxID=2053465 RepID=A0A2N5ZAP2_MUIH1|nr:MAG: hypothetical protein C0601_12305 [Candidatus Muirbacterium halophilum]